MNKNNHTTLYRKYRPNKFAEIIGQEPVVKTLQNAIAKGKVAHAYLFSGPRGVGKTTVARILAQSVNCENFKNGEPCNKCKSCEAMAGGSMDLVEIDAASNRGIDEVRALREKALFAPTEVKMKVFVIDEVHMLTKEAFNALLKLLEEPPAHAMFILATTEPQKIVATILSRCARFDFRPVSKKDLDKLANLIAKKEEVKLDIAALDLIVRSATGSARDLLSILGQIINSGQKSIVERDVKDLLGVQDQTQIPIFVGYLIKKKSGQAIEHINEILFSGYDAKELRNNILEYLRLLLLAKNEIKNIDIPAVYETEISKQKSEISEVEIILMIKTFLDINKWLAVSPVISLPFELAITEIVSSDEDIDNDNDNDDEEVISEKKEIKEIKPVQKSEKIESTIETSKLKTPINSIEKSWQKVIENLRSENFSVSTFLQVSIPAKIKKNILVIACKFSFHKEKINEMRNKMIIEEVLEKVFGEKIKIEVEVKEDLEINKVELKKAKASSNELVNDAENAFL
ncbi:MAG: DNA polymerase III subunit gamma/tau [bacterium]